MVQAIACTRVACLLVRIAQAKEAEVRPPPSPSDFGAVMAFFRQLASLIAHIISTDC